MRVLAVAVLLLLSACSDAPPPNVPVRTSTPETEVQCRPTLVRMVPPQSVMDTMFNGISPRPSATPSRDAWAATGNWIGNGALWISLPVDGIFQRRYSKLWMIPLKGGPITLSGRLLDGNRSGTFTGTASDGNIGSTVTFSTPGCWELAYTLAGEELRFTMKVED